MLLFYNIPTLQPTLASKQLTYTYSDVTRPVKCGEQENSVGVICYGITKHQTEVSAVIMTCMAWWCLLLTASLYILLLSIWWLYWIAISTMGCQPSTVMVFDSIGGRLIDRRVSCWWLTDLMQTKEKANYQVSWCVDAKWRYSDYELFTLTFIISICNGQDLTELVWNQSATRSYLLKYIEQG